MTADDGWSVPSSPSAPRRYGIGWMWCGVGLGLVTTMVLPLLGYVVADHLGAHLLARLIFLVALVAPFAIGLVLAAREGSPGRRGVGLGLIIGWGVAPVVFGGLSILAFVGAYNSA